MSFFFFWPKSCPFIFVKNRSCAYYETKTTFKPLQLRAIALLAPPPKHGLDYSND